MSKEIFARYGVGDVYGSDAPYELVAYDKDGNKIASSEVYMIEEDELYGVSDMVVPKDTEMPSYAVGEDGTEAEIYFIEYEDEDGDMCDENGEPL
jgi:hypothetical protein